MNGNQEPVSGELAELADAYGVATQYWDQGGTLVQVSGETVSAVLKALGVDKIATPSSNRSRPKR